MKGVFKFIIISFCVFSIVGFLFINYKGGISTYFVTYGTFENTLSTQGVIIRDEAILKADRDGILEPVVKEGEKVGSGKKIAVLYAKDVDRATKDELSNVSDEIEKVNVKLSKINLSVDDIGMLEGYTKKSIDNIVAVSLSGKLSTIDELKDELLILAEKKASILGEVTEDDNSLESLIAKKNKIEASLANKKTDIYARIGGYFSTNLDGFEAVMSLANIPNITIEDINNAVSTKSNNKKEVSTGENCITIQNSFYWAIACVVDAEKVKDVKIGDSVGVRLSEYKGKTLPSRVNSISTPVDGKVVFVVKTDASPTEISGNRRVNAEFVFNQSKGLKIPVSAIRIKDDKTGVYAVLEGVVRFREVDIIYKSEEIAIVSEDYRNGYLLLYDDIITKGNDIYDGKVIR